MALDEDDTSTRRARANSTLSALTQAQGPCHSAEGDYHGGWVVWEDRHVVVTGTGHVSQHASDICIVILACHGPPVPQVCLHLQFSPLGPGGPTPHLQRVWV